VITRDECVDRMRRIWDAVDDVSNKRSLTATDMLKFEALAEQFDMLDAARIARDAGVPPHEIPLVVAMLSK
jgi:hypothetical protein